MVNNWSLLLVGLIGIIVNFLLLNENLYAYMALHVVCQCWRGTATGPAAYDTTVVIRVVPSAARPVATPHQSWHTARKSMYVSRSSFNRRNFTMMQISSTGSNDQLLATKAIDRSAKTIDEILLCEDCRSSED